MMTGVTAEILIHACCGPCTLSSLKTIDPKNVVYYFFNPNIFPFEEYCKRLETFEKACKIFNLNYITEIYSQQEYEKAHRDWLMEISNVDNYYALKENSKRCEKCIQYRLKKIASICKKNNIPKFSTTLTASPQKDINLIKSVALVVSSTEKIDYLDYIFRKNNSFQFSLESCKKYNLYRQNYCGCEFSKSP
ncbi:MAG: epoxyqueuosine reductase QueH [Candidatus Woesearchaeota archaeon]